jgi:hypothetical protein
MTFSETRCETDKASDAKFTARLPSSIWRKIQQAPLTPGQHLGEGKFVRADMRNDYPDERKLTFEPRFRNVSGYRTFNPPASTITFPSTARVPPVRNNG